MAGGLISNPGKVLFSERGETKGDLDNTDRPMTRSTAM